jgi:hypothetical protein
MMRTVETEQREAAGPHPRKLSTGAGDLTVERLCNGG